MIALRMDMPCEGRGTWKDEMGRAAWKGPSKFRPLLREGCGHKSTVTEEKDKLTKVIVFR